MDSGSNQTYSFVASQSAFSTTGGNGVSEGCAAGGGVEAAA